MAIIKNLDSNKLTLFYTGKRRRSQQRQKRKKNSQAESTNSSISTAAMEDIIEKFRFKNVRNSTKTNYFSVWRSFNEFFIKLDREPETWEDRLVLFVGYLIDSKKQSQTIKSYISAIKLILRNDGVELKENKFLISSLTKACRYENDCVRTRLPIQNGLLQIIIKETKTYYEDQINQPYLALLYCTLFNTAYNGLFRVGELTSSEHSVRVTDVHIAVNKDKFLFILRSSKTHGKYMHPQSVQISREKGPEIYKNHKSKTKFCPFQMLRDYVTERPGYLSNSEPFFVFSDRQPVQPSHMRGTLKFILER